MKPPLLFVFVVLLAVVAAQPALSSPPGDVVDFQDFALCPDEEVEVNGQEIVVVSNNSTTPRGRLIHHVTILVSGSAVGFETGSTYTLRGVLNFGSNSGESEVFTLVATWQLLPDNGGKPLSLQQVEVIVINAQGEFTAFKHLGDPECTFLPGG
jgi:hypothetical protein